MNSKFLVPFETAQLLKKKGYPQESNYMYCDGERQWRHLTLYQMNKINAVASPTYHEVVDWLEEKGIYITCYAPLLKPVGRYAISVFNSNTNNWGLCRDVCPTREKALNESILKALEML